MTNGWKKAAGKGKLSGHFREQRKAERIKKRSAINKNLDILKKNDVKSV